MENFKALGVKSDFIKGLKDLGIINPTDIQKQVIPLLLDGNTDLVGHCLLYTSPSPRDAHESRMPSSA